ncbi:hypothetical protein CU633_21975 [Bacillus sp. V3-13]|uniref:DUF2604 domain-containing protein n=1 Tax=Bacillus sp. V3-13 TaxID=2053728 RepID=UPI000C7602CE|nr:DUF2604 domain-containing protein [Bacillus sp. V3-13]PLR75280.1 hypothetical protein CU633_21975 [Bacillus sp. V3-13]
MAQEKLLTIIVETIEGEEVELKINEENKVEKLVREAMKSLEIDPGSASYELKFQNQTLDVTKKIKDVGLTQGSVVLLQRIPVVG